MPESTAPPRLRIPGAPLTFQPHSFARPRAHRRKHPPSGQRFHMWISGCQMNESDADYLAQGLTAAGFRAVPDLDEADIAILVTCSVRQNAEQKAYGRFRELKGWKRARPGRAIAMTGCMANREKDRLFERLPDLDYRFDMREYEAFIQDLQGEYETDPAETESQFGETLDLLEEIKFDVVHIQGFSPRPRTTAARQLDDVSPQEKKRRINILLDAQRRIAEEANRRWLGQAVEVLVERAEDGEFNGRSRQNKVVVGSAPLGAEVGTVRRVMVEQASAWQLKGPVLN